jgi:RNase P protein component
MAIKRIIRESVREIGTFLNRRKVIVWTLEDLNEVNSEEILDYPWNDAIETFYISKNEYPWSGKHYHQAYSPPIKKKK